jgi:hypothetical protein
VALLQSCGQARVYVEQISRITGIADEKAKVLAKAFPTMCMLLDFLRQTSLKVGLGKKAAEMLYTQLLSREEQKFVF